MNIVRYCLKKRSYLFLSILFLVFTLQAHGAVNADKITLSFTNLPLKEAIRKIEVATGYTFFYDANKTDLTQTVSLDVKDASVEDALTSMLKPTGLTFEITSHQIALKPGNKRSGTQLPSREVKGTVTDEHGEPVIGASILVKGTSIGTITDLDGNFSLSVPGDVKSLVFSYIGMTSEDVAVKPNMAVVLKSDTQKLDEVVVTALGISREKKSLGYAVQDVKSGELTKAGQLNVTGSLAGKVAGVQITSTGGQVGASARIVIRGNSSFGENQPLIVVDGVPIANDQYSGTDLKNKNSTSNSPAVDYGSGLNDINPEDIESISVLKGGSAALYGMRAGNGVILITTKSGKRKDKGIQVNYDGNFSIDQMYGLLPMQNKYGQGYHGSEYDYALAKADGYTGSYQDFATGGYNNSWGYTYVDGRGNGLNDNVDESWGPRLDVGLKIPQYNSPIVNGVRQATDWISHPSNNKDFLQLGYSMNHSVSVLSQTDKSYTRVALGYRDQKGTIPNTDQKRYSAQMNTNMQICEQLAYNVSMNYTRTESDNMPTRGSWASNPFQSMNQWYARQVDMKDLKANWDKLDANGNHYNWNSIANTNPYWMMYKNTNSYQRNRLFGKASLQYSPFSFLKLEGRLGYDYYNTESNSVIAYDTSYHDGYFRLYNQAQTELNADFIASFNKQFSDFSVNVIAGANYRNLNWKATTLGADKLTIPELYTVSNANGSPVNEMDHTWIRSNSVYAQGSIGYKSMAYIDLSMRNDWDSSIKESFFYPSVSLSWLPTVTFPALQSDFLNFLKVRGGWAKVGSATDAYRMGTYYDAVSTTFNGVSQFYMPVTFPPQGLKPESVKTFEVGLETSLFKNRLGIDASYYNKTTTDQIMAVAISKTTGYSGMFVNAGEINNKGIELQVRASIIKDLDGWNWDLTLNWSKDKSKIVDLYTDPVTGQKLASYTIGTSSGVYVYAVPGEAWGTIYGKGMARNEKGEVIVDNAGIPVVEQNMKLGEVNPDWLAGLRSELSYRDLSFGFLLDFRKGGDVFSATQKWGTYSGLLEYTAAGDIREKPIVVGRDVLTDYTFVTQDGKPNTIETDARSFFTSGRNNNEMNVFDGSFLKLREVHVTYTVPQKALRKINFVKAANVSVIGSNLATLWLHSSNTAKIDPESSTGSGNNGVGLEDGSYPPTRSFGLKLGLTF